jgi:hypothetical protein
VNLLDSHGRTLAWFDRTVRLVRTDQWDNPTPCTEWAVRDVVNHIVSEQLWVPHLLNLCFNLGIFLSVPGSILR